MADIRVQAAPFDPGALLSEVQTSLPPVGALVSFTGIVRDLTGDLSALELEHYPAMTEAALAQMAQEATERFALDHVTILHRFGPLTPREPIMMVITASAHRKAAFEGADFLMDYLKSRAPFWKKEHRQGGATWVAAKQTDEDALAEWTKR
ncbi:MAG: molybdenum cofactor biosynthesis protein MoaE [Shimia sp.]